jgi:hypothetical protein
VVHYIPIYPLSLSETETFRAFLDGRQQLLPEVLLALVLREVQLRGE